MRCVAHTRSALLLQGVGVGTRSDTGRTGPDLVSRHDTEQPANVVVHLQPRGRQMTDDDLHDQLDAWLAEDEHEPWQPDEPSDVTPRDERQVNAMLRKRARLIAERDRVTTFVDEQVAQMRAFAEDRCAGIARQLTWLDRGLEQFARATLPKLKRKSLPLPDGTLKLTAPGAPSLVVLDVEAFAAWVDADESRAEFVKRDPKPVAAAIKAACSIGPKIRTDNDVDVFAVVDAAGERVPGVTMTKPSEDRFAVTARAYDQQEPNPKET